MRLQLVAFDIDNCLMGVNAPPTAATRERLARLAASGVHLALASGKPCVYLSGLVRGLGIMQASLIGENGAETWLGSTMPPERLLGDPPGEGEVAALAAIRDGVRERFGDRVFLQPNAVGVTAFPVDAKLTPGQIAAEAGVALPPTVTMYVHVDSVDWAISRFNKGTALRRLCTHLGIAMDATAAAGDSANDLPMLAVVRYPLWLGSPGALGEVRAECFGGITELLDRLLTLTGG